MTLGAMRPRPYPFQLLRDMLRTYWDTNVLPRPIIVEKPLPDYIRADLYNHGPHIVIDTGEINEELIHIGYRNLDVSVPMEMEILTAVSPNELNSPRHELESHRFRNQVLYDYAEEIQRIILLNQHDPNVYLIADFEKETASENLVGFTAENADITVNTMARYGIGCLRAVGNSAMAGKVTYAVPSDIESVDNELPLIPRPSDRLRVLKFWAAGGSDDVTLTVNMVLPGLDSPVEIQASRALPNIGTGDPEYMEFWVDFNSAIDDAIAEADGDVDIYDNVQLEFIFPANETLYLDQLVFSTCEYQMIVYRSFRPNTNAGQGYFEGTTRADFRSVGDPIDYLQ